MDQRAFISKLIDGIDDKIDRLAIMGCGIEDGLQGFRIDVFEARTNFCVW